MTDPKNLFTCRQQSDRKFLIWLFSQQIWKHIVSKERTSFSNTPQILTKTQFFNTQTVMAVYCVNEDTNPSSEYLLHTLQKVYETIKICVNMIELPLKTSSVILMPVFMVWNSCNPQWNQNLWRSPTLNGTTSLEMWSNASSHLPRLAGHELANLHICDVTLPLKISVRGSQCPKLLPIKSNE